MKKLLIIILSYTYLVSGGAVAQSGLPLTDGGFFMTYWETPDIDGVDALISIDDINNDGMNDLYAGSPNRSTNGLTNNGSIQAIDGSNGNIIWEVFGTSNDERLGLGNITRIDDINNNGASDLYVLSSSSIKAIDGGNGNTIWETLGTNVYITIIDDINNDGVNDLYTASPYRSTNGFFYNGCIQAIDGSNGNIIWEVFGTSNDEQLGLGNITRIDDINNDSVNDLYLALPNRSTNGFNDNGCIQAIDGSNGNIIWEVLGTSDDDQLGSGGITSIDDINNDSVNDLHTRSPNRSTNGFFYNGCIQAIDGSNGNVIWEALGTNDWERLGSEGVTISDDINNDGVSDLHLSSPSSIKAIDGGNGNAIWETLGTNAYITSIDDINNDGVSDLHVSSPISLQAMDGSNGNIIWEALGTDVNITIIDDINNDGVNDLYIGSPYRSTNGFSSNGRVQAIDGRYGNTIWEVFGTSDWQYLGGNVHAYGDLNSDGTADILTEGAWGDDGVSAHAIDGSNGSTLWETNNESGIYYVVSMPDFDIDNDGYLEWTYVSREGRLVLATTSPSKGMTASASMLSAGQGGNIDYDLDYPDDCAFYRYSLLFSMTSGSVNIRGLSVPLGYDLWLAQSYSGIYPQGFINPTGFLDANGNAQAGLNIPQNKLPASMIGTTINFASIVRLAWGEWELSSVAVPLLITP